MLLASIFLKVTRAKLASRVEGGKWLKWLIRQLDSPSVVLSSTLTHQGYSTFPHTRRQPHYYSRFRGNNRHPDSATHQDK